MAGGVEDKLRIIYDMCDEDSRGVVDKSNFKVGHRLMYGRGGGGAGLHSAVQTGYEIPKNIVYFYRIFEIDFIF